MASACPTLVKVSWTGAFTVGRQAPRALTANSMQSFRYMIISPWLSIDVYWR